MPEQVREQADGGFVGPVQVVEGEDQRLAGGDGLDERAHGLVQPVALDSEGLDRLGDEPGEGREHGAELFGT